MNSNHIVEQQKIVASKEPLGSAPLQSTTHRQGSNLLVRGVMSNWVVLGVTAVVSFVLTPILIGGLGEYYYGLWVLVMSVVGNYGLLDMGIRGALPRFIARYKGAGERGALDQTLATALALSVAVGIFLCGLTILLAGVLPDLLDISGPPRNTFVQILVLLGLTIAITFPERTLGGYLCGLQRFDLYNLLAVVKEILRAIILITLISRGYGIVTLGFVTLGITVFSLVLHYRMVLWADPQLSLQWRHARWQHLRKLFSFSIYLFVIDVGNQMSLRLDPLVITRWLGVGLVTQFSIASRLMDYFIALLTGVSNPLLPAMSELDGQSRREEFLRLFLRASKMTALLSLFIGTLLFFDGKALITLWLGESLAESSHTVLLVLTLGYVVALAQMPSVSVIFSLARHKPIAWLTLGQGIVNLALSIYLLQRYGIVGVALGTIIPLLAVYLLFMPWYVAGLLGLSARDYLAVLTRPLIVGGLFVVLCSLPSPPSDDLPYFLFRVLWQTASFSLLTYFVGFTAAERQNLWERIRYFPLTRRLLSN